MKKIGIETHRYSTLVKAVLDCCSNPIVLIDGSIESRNPKEWCTNRKLESIKNFVITQDGQEVISFHDHPRELIAPVESLPLIQKLATQKLLKYQLLKEA